MVDAATATNLATKPDNGFKVESASPGADPTKVSSQRTILNAPFQIRPLGQKTPYIKALFYGAHGAGKTTLAGTAVDCEPMRDVIMIDAESGELAIQDNPRIKNDELISHVRATSFKQVAYIHQFLQAHCKHRDTDNIPMLKKLESQVTGVPEAEIQVPKMYRTCIVDSLTEIDQYSLYALRGMKPEELLDDPSDIETVEFKGYNKNNDMVKMLCRAFRDLPMNILFVCSHQYMQNEMKKFHYTPAMTGKLSGQIQGMMDVVGYIVASTVENNEGILPRRMFVQPGEVGNARFDAKNRRAQYTSSYFDDPTMSQVMKSLGMLR